MSFHIQFLRGGGTAITLGFLCLCTHWAQGADLDESIRKVRMGGKEIVVELKRKELLTKQVSFLQP